MWSGICKKLRLGEMACSLYDTVSHLNQNSIYLSSQTTSYPVYWLLYTYVSTILLPISWNKCSNDIISHWMLITTSIVWSSHVLSAKRWKQYQESCTNNQHQNSPPHLESNSLLMWCEDVNSTFLSCEIHCHRTQLRPCFQMNDIKRFEMQLSLPSPSCDHHHKLQLQFEWTMHPVCKPYTMIFS